MPSRLKRVIRPFIPKVIIDRLYWRTLKRKAGNRGLEIVPYDLFFDLKRRDVVLRIKRAHSIYLEHMIENFDYYVESVIPVRVDGTMLVDMSGPRYHRLKGFGDVPFLFPSHTEPYRTTEEYLDFAGLKQGDVVLDIGAYAGITSIIFARLVGPQGHVYAFEADELNYECAKVNIEIAAKAMGIHNITLIRKAVWTHCDGLLFSNEGAMGSSAVSITGGKRGHETLVPSVRLQEFFSEAKLDHADFVKIDIEGCEIEVLQCSATWLREKKAKLIVEAHWIDGVLSTPRCSDILSAAGYKVRVREKVGESEPLVEALP